MRKKLFIASISALGVINVAFAQETTFRSLVTTLLNTVFNSLISLALVVATAAFFFGIYRYVTGARSGDSNQIAKGNQFILWGAIALFVMASMWGIVRFGQSTLGIGSTISLPSAASFGSNP